MNRADCTCGLRCPQHGRSEYVIWEANDGPILIADMTDEHLRNTVQMLRRTGQCVSRVMLKEFRRRGLHRYWCALCQTSHDGG